MRKAQVAQRGRFSRNPLATANDRAAIEGRTIGAYFNLVS